MGSWTLFVDESGLFEPRGNLWLPGMRLVGGVLVPLARGEARTILPVDPSHLEEARAACSPR